MYDVQVKWRFSLICELNENNISPWQIVKATKQVFDVQNNINVIIINKKQLKSHGRTFIIRNRLVWAQIQGAVNGFNFKIGSTIHIQPKSVSLPIN